MFGKKCRSCQKRIPKKKNIGTNEYPICTDCLEDMYAEGDLNKLNVIVSNGIDVSIPFDNVGRTGLMVSALHGHSEMVKRLLELNVDVNCRQHEDADALFLTLICFSAPDNLENISRYVEIVELLAKYGANLNRNLGGVTPLAMAVVAQRICAQANKTTQANKMAPMIDCLVRLGAKMP